MSNKKLQLNIDSFQDKEDFSGFVVDLRKNFESEIKEKYPEIKEKFILSEKKIKKIGLGFKKRAGKEINYLKKEAKGFNFDFFSLNKINLNKIKLNPKKIFKKNRWARNYRHKINDFQKEIKASSLGDLFKALKKTKHSNLKMAWYQSIFSFVLVLIIIIIPLKAFSYFKLLDLNKLESDIMGNSGLAINSLLAAGEAISKLDLSSADLEFQKAAQNFINAENDLSLINDSILSLGALSNDPKLKLVAESKKFLRAGAIISSLGQNLVLSSDSLFVDKKEDFSVSLDNFIYYGNLAVIDAKNLKNEINKINRNNLPDKYRDKFDSINKQVGILSENLESFISSGEQFKNLLGLNLDKRYLLVFQNNSELRASGGFIGSYALLDISNGKIKNLEVPGGGSYDTEGGMTVNVVAPKPLWLVNPLWHFWDANWWPDWPTTAKNLMWFYEKSGGPTVDGVIGVTPTIMEGLLEITGPIDLTKEYGLIITADNFWETTQKVVEHKNLVKTNPDFVLDLGSSSSVIETDLPLKQGLETNSDNKPKKIIGDLMAKILEVLPKKLTKDNLVKFLSLFEKSLSEKQVLFYFSDDLSQKEFSNRNWAGEIKNSKKDYLLVVNTNIAGQKSDRKMIEKIDHLSEVALDGSIINTLTITRTHTGIKNEALTGVRNVDWLRVYVPEGSELLSATGFKIPDLKYFNDKPDESWMENELLKNENNALVFDDSGTKIYTENNKTVFANWLMVDPGETEIVVLKYRLPFKIFEDFDNSDWLNKIDNFLNSKQVNLSPYSFLLQKQAGAKNSEFTSRLELPSYLSIFWSYPENFSKDNGWQIEDSLDSDKYWSVLIEKK